MTNDEKDNKKKLDNSVVTKKMLAVAFTSPVFFSVVFITIAFFATSNSSETVRTIFLVVATFVGLGVSIGVIFLMQKIINKKLKEIEDESQ
ncbi:MAG: hypothetical protein KGD64_00770 [Candidatus Heimdallarchaeota archaeon]|nr:hypothetical protein [Candidatus Heimdallarchaeota archaeon]